jgi:hypothetical protein
VTIKLNGRDADLRGSPVDRADFDDHVKRALERSEYGLTRSAIALYLFTPTPSAQEVRAVSAALKRGVRDGWAAQKNARLYVAVPGRPWPSDVLWRATVAAKAGT